MSYDTVLPLNAVIESGKQSIEQFIKTGSEATAKGYENIVSLTKDHVDSAIKAATSAVKSYDAAAAVGKENVDAFIAAGTAFAKGYVTFLQGAVALSQKQFENAVSATKQAMGSKTIKEFVDWQTEYARSNFDTLAGEGTKLSETGVRKSASRPAKKRSSR